jgi:hypothetical protein
MVLLVAIAGVVIAVGLWNQRNWARIGVIALQTLSVLISGWVLLVLLGGGLDITSAAILLPVIAIAGFIIYWFAKNGEYFA